MKRAASIMTLWVGLVAAACTGGGGGASGSPSPSVSPSPSTPVPTSSEAIDIRSPAVAAVVTSPLTVAGTANVFEGVVRIRILNSAGQRLADATTTASCGTGCRGTFSTMVTFRVTSAQPGVVMVFEPSGKDGTPIHVVRIPVTLSP